MKECLKAKQPYRYPHEFNESSYDIIRAYEIPHYR